jgi:flavin-binding protein dodecin
MRPIVFSGEVTRGQKRIKSGHIENQQIAHWQLTVKIGFTFEDAMNAPRSLL